MWSWNSRQAGLCNHTPFCVECLSGGALGMLPKGGQKHCTYFTDEETEVCSNVVTYPRTPKRQSQGELQSFQCQPSAIPTAHIASSSGLFCSHSEGADRSAVPSVTHGALQEALRVTEISWTQQMFTVDFQRLGDPAAIWSACKSATAFP